MPEPPLLFERLLAAVVDPAWRDSIVGDLREEYAERTGHGGRDRWARAWYAWQALCLTTRFMRQRRLGRRHQSDNVRREPLMWNLRSDLAYALRMLHRQRAFSLVVALTLALGLGVNAAVLGMMDALVLRPFQFADYERLLVLWETPASTAAREPVAVANFLDWRAQTRTLERLAATESWGATLSGRTDPERVHAYRVSPGFFELLGITPVAGRSFTPDEEQAGRDRRIVIGDGLWKRRFGADPAIVGKDVLLDGDAYVVVGIAPAGFEFPTGAELWAPLALGPERASNRVDRRLMVLAKLTPTVTLPAAQAELDVIGQRLAREYPATNRERGVAARTLSTAFREDTMVPFVGILQAAAALVLLVACANLVGLLLARAVDRQRELAVRTALGASRLRILRQLLIETMLLGLVASAVAILFAKFGLDVLRSALPAGVAQHVEGWNNLRLDSRVMMLIPALAIGTGLLVGFIPALGASRLVLTDALKDGDRGAVGRGHQRWRQTLVVAEIAFALALLISAGLTVTAGLRLVNQPGGFDAARLLALEIQLPENKYRDEQARREFAEHLLREIGASPEVERAALANVLPAAGYSPSTRFVAEDHPIQDVAQWPQAGYRAVSTGYFDTLRIPIVRGRAFSDVDREQAPRVALISASLAERLWPGRDPIGKRLRLENQETQEKEDKSGDEWITIVGVAGDVSMYNWWDGVDYAAIYVPFRQAPPTGMHAAIRSRGEPTTMTQVVRTALRAVEPSLPISRARTMKEAIAESSVGLAYLSSLLAICGGIAAVLAIAGIYSVMAYTISSRAREFGVRMALGATAGDVLRLTLTHAGTLTAIGVAVGLSLALLLARLLSSALFGMVSIDAFTFVGTSLLLGLLSLTAAYLPARRVLGLSPTSILR